jgi:hypothetical protein
MNDTKPQGDTEEVIEEQYKNLNHSCTECGNHPRKLARLEDGTEMCIDCASEKYSYNLAVHLLTFT